MHISDWRKSLGAIFHHAPKLKSPLPGRAASGSRADSNTGTRHLLRSYKNIELLGWAASVIRTFPSDLDVG